VEYLYNLVNNRLDNSIPRLEDITRVLIVDIVIEGEEVIKDIKDIKDIIEVIKA
jgi:hypothetical protein